jgi:multidrug efflux pump subunit AcrB
MRSIVRWAVHNSPSMNTLMVAVLTVGLGSLALLRRETFPRFELDIVLATVIYPGASPSEIEEGICQKIEEAVRAIDGIKKITSIADEGRGFVVCELESNVRDPQRVLNEIRSEIDRIPSFPLDAEDPQVQQIVIRNPAIRVSVVGGPDIPEGGGNLRAERQLRDLAEQVRDELLLLPSVSQVTIVAERPYQIDVEIPEATLRKYGLSLSDVAQAIRNENIEQPAGTIRTESHEFLVRGQNKYLLGQEIAALPALKSGGNTILVGELGYVRDGFEDTVVYNRINGRPALTMQVEKTADEDLLQIVAEVRQYSEEKQHQLPQGYELVVWSDGSQDVRDRLELLTRTGLSGLVLVFVVLSIFLEIRLAFWVALGIPVSVLGACAVMLAIDSTLNMLTMFAFVMGLGIVVDDAIVIGENIYKHRQLGKNAFRAAIDGTVEVAPSVMASVATTIIAFVPLAMVSGVMGKFIGVMPPVIIAMLVISLVESLIILPCHLAHSRGETEGWNRRFRRRVEGGVEAVVQRVYLPSLRWSLDHPAAVYSGAIMSFLLTLGLIRGGFARRRSHAAAARPARGQADGPLPRAAAALAGGFRRDPRPHGRRLGAALDGTGGRDHRAGLFGDQSRRPTAVDHGHGRSGRHPRQRVADRQRPAGELRPRLVRQVPRRARPLGGAARGERRIDAEPVCRLPAGDLRHVLPVDAGVPIVFPAVPDPDHYSLRIHGRDLGPRADGPAADDLQHVWPGVADGRGGQRFDCHGGLHQPAAAGGHAAEEALLEAGRRRFRPVLLTSMTTVAGLAPMLMETSFQAQVLVPMAASLAFGLIVPIQAPPGAFGVLSW